LILDDIRQLKTGRSELRKFGLLVGGVFALFGIIMLLRGKPHYPWFLVPGGFLILGGAIFPAVLKHVYIAWMSLAFVMGFVISHILLTLFFYFVITPIGLIARLVGKDFLRLKLDRNANSYWIPRQDKSPKSPADYERQF
jgi:hypothetical protein